MGTSNFVRVSSSRKCRICGRNSLCYFTKDELTHVCCREGVGPNGEVGKHRMRDLWEEWVFYFGPKNWKPAAPTPSQSTGQVAIAPVVKRHLVYDAMLDHMELSAAHLEHMTAPYPKGRGLTVDAVKGYKYRSLGSGRSRVARHLQDTFGDATLLTIPGLLLEKNDNGSTYWSIGGLQGILIPNRDTNGRIAAIQIRVDNPPDPENRYFWLGRLHSGAPTNEPTCHVPLPRPNVSTRTIRVTEGLLKADIATALDPSILTVGCPGVYATSALSGTAKELDAKTVRLAFDMDFMTNEDVARAYAGCVRLLREADLECEFETWDPSIKGLDEVIALKAPTTISSEPPPEVLSKLGPP